MFYVDWLEVETSLDLAIISNGSMRERFTFIIKDGKVRDTGSVEPGSRPIFGPVSDSENQFLGI